MINIDNSRNLNQLSTEHCNSKIFSILQNVFWKFIFSLQIYLKEVWYNKNLLIKFLLNFLELFIIGKYVKTKFKNKESPCYFLSFRGQKIKNITKTEQRWLFLFTFLVSFFIAFLVQKLIYTINIYDLILRLTHVLNKIIY